jgi:hypothetical protein
MFDLRHADGAERVLLQMRQLRKYERMLIEPNSWMVSLRTGCHSESGYWQEVVIGYM